MELPEITGNIEFKREVTATGVTYHMTWVGGDTIAIGLKFLHKGYEIGLFGDKLIIGPHTTEIIGYQSPGILVCKRITSE